MTVGRIRAELAAVSDDLVERLLALRPDAGAKSGDQTVDDLLVVGQLLLGVLGRLHHRPQQRDATRCDTSRLSCHRQSGACGPVLDVVIGERLHGGVNGLVAGLSGIVLVEQHRANAADRRDYRLRRIDGVWQSNKLPGRPELDHVGNLQEGELGRILFRGRRSRDHHGVLVERQVFRQTAGGVGGNHVRERAVKTVPDRLLVPADQFLPELGDSFRSPGGRRGDLGDDILGDAGGRQVLRASP